MRPDTGGVSNGQRRVSGFEPERHRAVVDETYLHMGAETADFHGGMAILRNFHQPLEPAPAGLGRRRGRETGAHARIRVRRQGELRQQQQAAAGLGQRPVHLAVRVGEDAVAEQAFAHSLRLRLAVARLHGHQGEQARADARDGFAINVYLRLEHTLYQGNHVFSIHSP